MLTAFYLLGVILCKMSFDFLSTCSDLWRTCVSHFPEPSLLCNLIVLSVGAVKHY